MDVKVILQAALASALLLATGFPASALTADQALQARKSRYREVGAAFKTINDQAKSGTLIKITLKSSARLISAAARDQYMWFPAGSGPSPQVKTKALPAIWSDPAKFKRAQDDFRRQADLMAVVAEKGDLAQVRAQARLLGQACAACHRPFRQED